MSWNLEEAIAYYRVQGADQNTLVSLLREAQQNSGGAVPPAVIPPIAAAFQVKENFLLALIRRMPSLRLSEQHLLQVCAGPNCGKHRDIALCAQNLQSQQIQVSFVPCQRMCGKGPNIKWDGKLYHRATPELLKQLAEDAQG